VLVTDQRPAAPMDPVSVIAMIVSIVGLVLVSLPLGIWGVIRTKNGRRRGRAFAIASFVLTGVWAILGGISGLVIALTLPADIAGQPLPPGLTPTVDVVPTPSAAASTPTTSLTSVPTASTTPGNQPTGPLRKPKRLRLDQLKIGDCITDLQHEEFSRVRVVDCRTKHEQQVLGGFKASGRKYPGDSALQAVAESRCRTLFEKFVGIPFDDSYLEIASFAPTVGAWRAGNRLVVCTALDPDTSQATISFKNLRR